MDFQELKIQKIINEWANSSALKYLHVTLCGIDSVN